MISGPVVLIILDGFGYARNTVESPWNIAQCPNIREIEKFFPLTTLQASGIAVGLPWGEEGNSEVGHLTMGAGRIMYNHLPRITMAIQNGRFMNNEAFLGAAEHVKKNNGCFHIMGLFSSGSVHAFVDHLYALLEFSKKNNLVKTELHLFTDGRDASIYEGAKFVRQLEGRLAKNYPNIRIASVIGRHYAMDRDGKWNNTEKAYKLLTECRGTFFEQASMYIEDNYKRGITDEFIEPGFCKDCEPIKNGDALVFFNYREDSARQLSIAFVQPEFDNFPRNKIADLNFVTMTRYSEKLPAAVAFVPSEVMSPLAKIISSGRMKQLHIAETEKYAHVTYFFNGGREDPFEGEDRVLVPSPSVSHYDLQPEMSAHKIKDRVMAELGNYDFIIINFANMDMVGHTGNFEACVKAMEIVDNCLGQLVPEILKAGGVALITADHGNIEEKTYSLTGEKRTKHTTNPVPFYLVGSRWQRKEPRAPGEIEMLYKDTKGTLTDVAPTILEILELEIPPEMTGKSLLSFLR